uniref:Uncharacterized protein n=1 Tax=Eutreptiella gymnastica TaxID=73025 RepID=A0A7S1NMR7_9EUGL
MPPAFGDVYKPVKDLLTKKYNGTGHKLDIKAKDGVTFNPVITKGKGATVSIEGTYDPCEYAGLKLKYTIATAGNLTTKMTLSKLAPGLVVEGNWDAALGEDSMKDKFDVKATYTASAGNVEAKVVKAKETTAELSGVVAPLADLNLGASVKYNLITKKQQGLSVVGSYLLPHKTTAAVVFDRKDKDVLTAGLINKSCPRYTTAVSYEADMKDLKAGSIILGTERKLESGQIIKAKATSSGDVGVSFQHTFNKYLSICTSLEVAKGKSMFGSELIYSA